MRETVEFYELIAKQTDKVTVEFYDPMLNPAQARLRGVQFAGTSVMESEGRRLQIDAPTETDIANGILRVSMGVQETLCFLDGHREPDPFSQETHDHIEGAPGHSHGLGPQYVLHQQHGMAKARHALETMNYKVEKISLTNNVGADALSRCSLLVVAGPQLELLPPEVAAIRTFLAAGGDALFMLDPFVRTGIEPVLREYGIVVDDDIVIDEASHFWADSSSPAVTDYNYHRITSDLPLTFFPGARSLSPTPQRIPGVNVIPLANSSKSSWGQHNPTRVEFQEGRDIRGPATLMAVANRRPMAADDPVYRSAEEQLRGSSKALEKEHPRNPATALSRIAVVGDSDFATNSFFHIMGNGKLFLNTVNYLAARENLIGLEPRTYDLPRVNLTNRQMKGTFFLSVVLSPRLLALVGIAVWWRQDECAGGTAEVARRMGSVVVLVAAIVVIERTASIRLARSGTTAIAMAPPHARCCQSRWSRSVPSRWPTPARCIASSATPRAPGSTTACTVPRRARTSTGPTRKWPRASSVRLRCSTGHGWSGSSRSTSPR